MLTGANFGAGPSKGQAKPQVEKARKLVEVAKRMKSSELALTNLNLLFFPEEVSRLFSLERLSLSENAITTIPDELCWKLTNLTSLSLSNNQLSFLPEYIGLLTNLEILYLNKNNLRSLPSQIGCLENLEGLYLAENKLGRLPPQIGYLTNLERLSLNDNCLAQLPGELGKLTNLSSLYLKGNDFDKKFTALTKTTTVRILARLRTLRIESDEVTRKGLIVPPTDEPRPDPFARPAMKEDRCDLNERPPSPGVLSIRSIGVKRERKSTADDVQMAEVPLESPRKLEKPAVNESSHTSSLSSSSSNQQIDSVHVSIDGGRVDSMLLALMCLRCFTKSHHSSFATPVTVSLHSEVFRSSPLLPQDDTDELTKLISSTSVNSSIKEDVIYEIATSILQLLPKDISDVITVRGYSAKPGVISIRQSSLYTLLRDFIQSEVHQTENGNAISQSLRNTDTDVQFLENDAGISDIALFDDVTEEGKGKGKKVSVKSSKQSTATQPLKVFPARLNITELSNDRKNIVVYSEKLSSTRRTMAFDRGHLAIRVGVDCSRLEEVGLKMQWEILNRTQSLAHITHAGTLAILTIHAPLCSADYVSKSYSSPESVKEFLLQRENLASLRLQQALQLFGIPSQYVIWIKPFNTANSEGDGIADGTGCQNVVWSIDASRLTQSVASSTASSNLDGTGVNFGPLVHNVCPLRQHKSFELTIILTAFFIKSIKESLLGQSESMSPANGAVWLSRYASIAENIVKAEVRNTSLLHSFVGGASIVAIARQLPSNMIRVRDHLIEEGWEEGGMKGSQLGAALGKEKIQSLSLQIQGHFAHFAGGIEWETAQLPEISSQYSLR